MARELFELPPELVDMILLQVPDEPEDIINLRLVCKYFNETFHPDKFHPEFTPSTGLKFPAIHPVTTTFLYKHMDNTHYRHSNPSPTLGRIIHQTVQDLINTTSPHLTQTPTQYTQDLCHMASTWNKLISNRTHNYYYPTNQHHTLAALAYYGDTAAFTAALLPTTNLRSITSDYLGCSLYWATVRGHLDIIKLHFDPSHISRRIASFDRSMPSTHGLAGLLFLASFHAQLSLLPHMLPSAHLLPAIRAAAHAGSIPTLRFLLQHLPSPPSPTYRKPVSPTLTERMEAATLTPHAPPPTPATATAPTHILLAGAASNHAHIVTFAIDELGADIDSVAEKPDVHHGQATATAAGTQKLTLQYSRGHAIDIGKPAVWSAAKRGWGEMVEMLVRRGARVEGEWGAAADGAREGGWWRMVGFLEGKRWWVRGRTWEGSVAWRNCED